MAFTISTPLGGAQPIAETSTKQRHPLGTIVRAVDPVYGEGEFIYAKGVVNTVVGSVAALNTYAGTTTLTVAGTRGPVGVAMSANVANQFGWYQVVGSAVVKTGTVAANTPAYSTSTAGQLDDAVVSGDKLDAFVLKTANGTPAAGFAVAQIALPSMDGNG